MTTEIVKGEVLPTLAENEEVIERGLASFVTVGQALLRVRDGSQYVEAGFDTFEAYCKRRWDFGSSHANHTIAAAQVASLCSGGERRPNLKIESVFVARPLARVLNEDGEEAVVNAWREITRRHEGDGPVTSGEVRRFLTVGANYGKPGWNELLGVAADHLAKAAKELDKLEPQIKRRPNQGFRERADEFADRAGDIAQRLRKLAA